MRETRKIWLEMVGAITLIGGSTAAVLAQGGGPPPTPKCYGCQPSPGQCDNLTTNSDECCCCQHKAEEYWDCRVKNNNFDCVGNGGTWINCFTIAY
jgi:hypothetical protein